MKRIVLLVTAAAVALSPLAASAAPAKRTVTFEYSGFATAGTDGLSVSWDAPCVAFDACWDFSTKKGEKTIEIEGSDPNVGFQIWTDGDYEGTVASFCGSGKITVSPKAAHEVSVRPFLSDCGGVPTQGTFTGTITSAK